MVGKKYQKHVVQRMFAVENSLEKDDEVTILYDLLDTMSQDPCKI